MCIRDSQRRVHGLLKKQNLIPKIFYKISQKMKGGKKKILLIIAHPNVDKSFNHKLAENASKQLTSMGHEVRVVDLYKIKYNPVGGKGDFIKLKNPDNFDYQIEQKNAMENKLENFTQEMKDQIENVKWADVLYFQFPFYWFSVPAILKGWIDKTFAYYFVYGGDNNLKGKKWFTSTTTGGPESAYKDQIGTTVESFLTHFNYQTPKLIQMDIIPIFVAHGVNYATPEQKEKMNEDLITHLKKHF
eukprot:TRINITY_DN5471_c0_g1_i3.p2 TRINITY_DN5471_c0_g1~~TRINITY_DN5471_c0_g1_i3.p2  ORF type:complete len:245 (-),score=63.62 TRINITY_DN5471_c0_g1_i3:248-982(-)